MEKEFVTLRNAVTQRRYVTALRNAVTSRRHESPSRIAVPRQADRIRPTRNLYRINGLARQHGRGVRIMTPSPYEDARQIEIPPNILPAQAGIPIFSVIARGPGLRFRRRVTTLASHGPRAHSPKANRLTL